MEQLCEQLIEIFLQINPNPSDKQFHALAESVGIDKETLEAVSYEMLGEEVNKVMALTDEELVQQGDLQPTSDRLAILIDHPVMPAPKV